MITIYSLFWSVINCCLMAFIIFLLRTRTELISRYGTAVPHFLVICCIIRILFPVEFPDYQYVIADNFLFSWVVEHFKFILHPEYRRIGIIAFVIVWFGGSAVSLFFLVKKSLLARYILHEDACIDYPKAKKILDSIDPDCKVETRLCSGISTPILAGYLHPKIYFPTLPYTDEEVRLVLLHEYSHWKRHDIWKKLAMNIICIVFWWNPAVFIIRRELDQLLEFCCDKRLSKGFEEMEILDYLNLLIMTSSAKKKKSVMTNTLFTIDFADKMVQHTIQQRFDLLFYKHRATKHRKLAQAGMILLGVVWMVSSYYFILQTKFSTPEESLWTSNAKYENNKVVYVADEKNTYLEEQEDGSYLFYFNGIPMEVPSEDVEAGLYDYYPIIVYEDDGNPVTEFFTNVKEYIINIFHKGGN